MLEHSTRTRVTWRNAKFVRLAYGGSVRLTSTAERFLNGRTVVLESGGHHVFLTNEADVARLILSFLAELPSP
jgi:pimeloyl-ACP methyl ester carboxylesterase